MNRLSNEQSTVILGDCVEVFKDIPFKSVQLIFADPPYGIGKDFGNNKGIFASADGYLAWCKNWIYECMRILSDTGTMHLMSSTQYMPTTLGNSDE